MSAVVGAFLTMLAFAFRSEEEIEIPAEQIARFEKATPGGDCSMNVAVAVDDEVRNEAQPECKRGRSRQQSGSSSATASGYSS